MNCTLVNIGGHGPGCSVTGLRQSHPKCPTSCTQIPDMLGANVAMLIPPIPTNKRINNKVFNLRYLP